jgi:hypothetical protein
MLRFNEKYVKLMREASHLLMVLTIFGCSIKHVTLEIIVKNRHYNDQWCHIYSVDWYYDVIIKSVSGRLWHE